ncbi:MAG: thiamine pyrophosphate-binding protein [Proteobacteria bacterium]|nr:thiamine pyrophosphate-binding protein [Pseudomonadota bacterium]
MAVPMLVADASAVRDTEARITLAEALVRSLSDLGVRDAYGISGGAIAALWHAMAASPWQVCHFRHESGAAFAATEASLATGRPVVVYTTTGPGLTNALTGLLAARGEGARVILVSGYTASAGHGRHAIQETSPFTMPAEFHAAGSLFHQATVLDAPGALPALMRRLANGLARPQGWVAHIALPTAQQAAPTAPPLPVPRRAPVAAVPEPALLDAAGAALRDAPFAVWIGHGARGAAREVRAFIERTGAPIFCTPRAKGIVPEMHPQFIGVSGMGGHDGVAAWVQAHAERILVLGTRLGEASSLWDARYAVRRGFVHVDVDPQVPCAAYPDAPTLAVSADVGAFLRAVLVRWPAAARVVLPSRPPPPSAPSLAASDRVRPEFLMQAIQRRVVDAGDAIVLAESGHSFIWATRCLRFATPGRYRVSTGVGAMGHAACGVVGAALASGRRAVAIVGDGSMLMNNELHSAVKYGARAVWIVLNDGRYGMCHQGMQALGLGADALFPEVDFAALARALGAQGLRVAAEDGLDAVLDAALQAAGPCVVDVLVDPAARAPTAARNRGLARLLADGGDAEPSFPPR